MADLQQVRAAKVRLRVALTGREGVGGIGITRVGDGYCLRVNVSRPADGAGLPVAVDGVHVVVRVTGPIRAHT